MSGFRLKEAQDMSKSKLESVARDVDLLQPQTRRPFSKVASATSFEVLAHSSSSILFKI